MKTREEMIESIMKKKGPKTEEGRKRISHGMKRYWDEYHRLKKELQMAGAIK